MHNDDKDLLSIILVSEGLLVKMSITRKPLHISQSILRQAVGIKESVIDSSVTTYCIYILEQFNYISFTYARQIKIA